MMPHSLDGVYPDGSFQVERAPGPTGTIEAPVEHLDLATVLKVSQAVSGEIVQEKLLETLMRTAIEQSGAGHALLILPRGGEPRIAAEATTGDAIVVQLRDELMTTAVLPELVIQYVVRTNESVILDDAAAQNAFSARPVPELPPEPHESLSPEAAAIWREILGTVHHSQFRGAEFLLEAFCRTVAFERQLGREIEALPHGKARDELAKARRAEAALAASLATKLRLSPRSRTDKNVRLRTVPPGRKPWEIIVDDDPPKAG